MTYQFDPDDFGPATATPTLVLVDLDQRHLRTGAGLDRATLAGVVAHCRKALAHARQNGYPVVHFRGDGWGKTRQTEWIKGFEPLRSEAIFERRNNSCYSSPYFEEAMNANGRNLVMAGFLGRGGCLSTAADAVVSGHRVTFLKDAVFDEVAAQMIGAPLLALLAAFTKVEISAATTHNWTKASIPLSPRLALNA